MDSSQASQEMAMLNINQRVTALSAGNLNPQRSNNDILLIGTPTNLLGKIINLLWFGVFNVCLIYEMIVTSFFLTIL